MTHKQPEQTALSHAAHTGENLDHRRFERWLDLSQAGRSFNVVHRYASKIRVKPKLLQYTIKLSDIQETQEYTKPGRL
jgi:hypothetical protein